VLIGYARVSTVNQNLDLQRNALTEAGCDCLYTEQMSGAVTAILPHGHSPARMGATRRPAVQHEHGRRDRALRGCSRSCPVQVCGGAGERLRIQP
jgi:hypothetical protein